MQVAWNSKYFIYLPKFKFKYLTEKKTNKHQVSPYLHNFNGQICFFTCEIELRKQIFNFDKKKISYPKS